MALPTASESSTKAAREPGEELESMALRMRLLACPPQGSVVNPFVLERCSAADSVT